MAKIDALLPCTNQVSISSQIKHKTAENTDANQRAFFSAPLSFVTHTRGGFSPRSLVIQNKFVRPVSMAPSPQIRCGFSVYELLCVASIIDGIGLMANDRCCV